VRCAGYRSVARARCTAHAGYMSVGLQHAGPAAVAAFFAPERPGPLILQHVAASGVGRCRADRMLALRTAVVEVPQNSVACRGEPVVVPGLRGLVEAPSECCLVALWVPRTLSPHATCTYSWMRPPSRSRRSGRTVAPERGGGVLPAGGR
jgi:hypothetical protein